MTFSTISIRIAIFVSKDDEKFLIDFGVKTFKTKKKAFLVDDFCKLNLIKGFRLSPSLSIL